MPINNDLLNEPINRHVKVLEDATLMEAFAALKAAKGYLWWHLIIENQDNTWAALRFSDLDPLLFRLGPESFTTPLCDLPLNSVHLEAVDQENIDPASILSLFPENGERIFAVIRDDQFAGIICDGGTRGEFFAGSIASELYGTLADLSADARIRYQ